MRIRVLLGALVIGFASLVGPQTAEACSPSCSPLRLFDDGSRMPVVPGNLVYFKVLTDKPLSDFGVELRRSSGEIVPTSVARLGSDRVLSPSEPLAPETSLVLRYRDPCKGPTEYKFRTTEHAEVPSEMGKLQTNPMSGGRYNVDYVPPEGYGHLVDTDSKVDEYQATEFADETYPRPPFVTRVGLAAAGECGYELRGPYDSCGNYFMFSPGKHTVKIEASFVGQVLPSETLEREVELKGTVDCTDAVAADDAEPGGDAEPDGDAEPLHHVRSCAVGSPAREHPGVLSALGLLLVLRFRRHKPRWKGWRAPAE